MKTEAQKQLEKTGIYSRDPLLIEKALLELQRKGFLREKGDPKRAHNFVYESLLRTAQKTFGNLLGGKKEKNTLNYVENLLRASIQVSSIYNEKDRMLFSSECHSYVVSYRENLTRLPYIEWIPPFSECPSCTTGSSLPAPEKESLMSLCSTCDIIWKSTRFPDGSLVWMQVF